MISNRQHIKKIWELCILHPESEVIFNVRNEIGGDYQRVMQSISRIEHSEVYATDEQILVGEDEILELLCENVYDEELAKVDGNRENMISDEDIEHIGNERLRQLRESDKVSLKIIVHMDDQ